MRRLLRPALDRRWLFVKALAAAAQVKVRGGRGGGRRDLGGNGAVDDGWGIDGSRRAGRAGGGGAGVVDRAVLQPDPHVFGLVGEASVAEWVAAALCLSPRSLQSHGTLLLTPSLLAGLGGC